MSGRSSRTSRCSTSPSATTGPSRATTSPMTRTADVYVCPAGKQLRKYRRAFATPRLGVMKDNTLRYRASKHDCDACPLKPRCCPNAPARKVTRSIHEAARDKARAIAKTEAYVVSRESGRRSRCCSPTSNASSGSTDCAYEVPSGARDEFLLAATAQNLRKLAKLIAMPLPIPTI